MSELPRVSVLMAFYKGERYIREAIESVLAQDFTSWEFLLVDDGGGDGSAAIVEEFAAKHPGRIRRLEHDGNQNRGPSASRNLGLSRARGAFIAFIDQDDVWIPTKLTEQVAILDGEPRAAMTFGPSWIWYSWSADATGRERDTLQDEGFPRETLVKPPHLVCLFLANRMVIPSPSGILVRKTASDAVGGFEDVFRGIYEDKVFYVKLALEHPVFVSGRCWYKYRRHPDSALVVAADQGRYFKLWLEFLAWVGRHMRERGVESPEVRRVLDEQVARDSKFRWTVALGRLPGVMGWVKWVAMRLSRKLVSHRVQAAIARLWQASYLSPPKGGVQFGDLARPQSLSPIAGLDRGRTVAQALIAGFLKKHASKLTGAVVEWPDHGLVKGALTSETGMPGSAGPVEVQVKSLAELPAESADALVLAHHLQHERDPAAAIESARRALKIGGVLIATLPCLAPVARYDLDRERDYWRFTPHAAALLFGNAFGDEQVTVEPLGNTLAAVAALHGVAADETPGDLTAADPDCPVIVGVRAVKIAR